MGILEVARLYLGELTVNHKMLMVPWCSFKLSKPLNIDHFIVVSLGDISIQAALPGTSQCHLLESLKC